MGRSNGRCWWVGLFTLVNLHSGWGAEWKPAPGPLSTRWTQMVTPETAHREYPRPQLVRNEWLNLNGLWDYAIRPQAEMSNRNWEGKILVPFPVESALSGVRRQVGPENRLWYRRSVEVPQAWKGRRVLLRFGAVDWETTVWVNRREVVTHRGGYDPFSADITDAVKWEQAEQEIQLRVWDPSDAGPQPRGKQVRRPEGIWYTPTTGIWQTAWLEPVSPAGISRLKITPHLDQKRVELEIEQLEAVAGSQIEVIAGATELHGTNRKGKVTTVTIPVSDQSAPRLWTPDDPYLYPVKLRIKNADGTTVDEVSSYYALRKISMGKDSQGVNRLLLNNKPVFHFGPLDQGFWPDGLYTAPTDAALKFDIEMTKKLGFNMIRKHVKVEPARWYHHCDTLGMLVWQDIPSGDAAAPWGAKGEHDGKELRRSPASVAIYEQEMQAIVAALYNAPSIVVWVPFNEGWGQFDTVRITRRMQDLDPTRLLNCASGGNDFPVGHIYDLHRYPGPIAPRLESGRVSVLGEFGGLGLPVRGHTWQAEKNWGYRSFKTEQELTAAYLDLQRKLTPLITEAGLSAAVYTQTTDVEIEVNGLFSYDRERLKFPLETVSAVNRRISNSLSEAAPQQR